MSTPAVPSSADRMRASDAERDQAVETLACAAAEGRLTLEEYSERSGAALQARTLGELTALTDDIPAGPGTFARRETRPAVHRIGALLGNESRKGRWVVPPHLIVRSVLGDCHLEMQHAVIGQHVTVIDATVRFGAMTVFVPDGIDVRLNGRAVLGAKSSQLHGEPRPGAPVIEINCDVFCGSVNVRRPKFSLR